VNGKVIAGIGLIVGVVVIALLAAPIQAHINRSGSGDLLQAQEQDRLRMQDYNNTCYCVHTQYAYRQRANECAASRICNCTMSMEQYRNQNRERTRRMGH